MRRRSGLVERELGDGQQVGARTHPGRSSSPMTSRNSASSDWPRRASVVEPRARGDDLARDRRAAPRRPRPSEPTPVAPRGDDAPEAREAGERRGVGGRRARARRSSAAPGPPPSDSSCTARPCLTNDDAVAGGLDLAEQVRVEEHGGARALQLADQVAHQQPAERIEPRGGLVEEHQLGLVEQRLREPDALQHALAVLAQLAVRGVEQVHAREQLVERAPRAAAARRP